jgi:hypothetical protein
MGRCLAFSRDRVVWGGDAAWRVRLMQTVFKAHYMHPRRRSGREEHGWLFGSNAFPSTAVARLLHFGNASGAECLPCKA